MRKQGLEWRPRHPCIHDLVLAIKPFVRYSQN